MFLFHFYSSTFLFSCEVSLSLSCSTGKVHSHSLIKHFTFKVHLLLLSIACLSDGLDIHHEPQSTQTPPHLHFATTLPNDLYCVTPACTRSCISSHFKPYLTFFKTTPSPLFLILPVFILFSSPVSLLNFNFYRTPTL